MNIHISSQSLSIKWRRVCLTYFIGARDQDKHSGAVSERAKSRDRKARREGKTGQVSRQHTRARKEEREAKEEKGIRGWVNGGCVCERRGVGGHI